MITSYTWQSNANTCGPHKQKSVLQMWKYGTELLKTNYLILAPRSTIHRGPDITEGAILLATSWQPDRRGTKPDRNG